MKDRFTLEQIYLVGLLRQALANGQIPDAESPDFKKLLAMASKHAVLPLLYDVLENQELPQAEWNYLVKVSRKTVWQSYYLLYLTNRVTALLQEAGITVVVLKGCTTAALYPVPELRKSGDIDLLLPNEADVPKACRILEGANFMSKEEQKVHHHLTFTADKGITIELHTMFAEPFDNQRINRYLQTQLGECSGHIVTAEIMGCMLPVFDEAYHGFYLLLHMLQHFLRSGFGLKLLCDWVVFWNRDLEEMDERKFLHLVTECGIINYTRTITAVCIRYLGLRQENMEFLYSQPITALFTRTMKEMSEEFLAEVLEAEEFGKSGSDRMVVMHGAKLSDYLREFHHQMRLNYPKAGGYVLLWPALWVMTLILFLYNNHKIRRVSGIAVLKKAGKRSRLMEYMDLFTNE